MNEDERTRNSFWLWFSMVGAPFIWVAHFMVMWAITEMGCRLDAADTRILGVYAVHLLAVISTVVTLGIIVAAGLTAYRRWQSLRRDAPLPTASADDPLRRIQFMNVLGMLFSGLFGVTTIYMLIPVFVLPICAAVR